MLTIDLDPKLELSLEKIARHEQISVNEFVNDLISRYLSNQNQANEEDEALLIHEQLMNQYAETFEKLAQ